jgi:hypothetical protein
MAKAMIAFYLGLQNVFPHHLVFIRNRLHKRLDEIFGGLYTKNGKDSALGLYPQSLFLGARV